MSIGQAYREWLTPREQKALDSGCVYLIDSLFDDLSEIEEWEAETFVDTVFGCHLPNRYLSNYTSGFFRQFAVCLIIVSWKLAQPQHIPLASVAEELAAWAIINQAKSAIEMGIGEEGEGDLLVPARDVSDQACGEEDEGASEDNFECFIDHYFDDLDFLFLFDDAYDGIDASPAGAITSMASLSFQNWFHPFANNPDLAVHPYHSDE